MDIHEDPEPDAFEKITRFVCGALFGFFVGGYLALRLFDLQTFPPLIAIAVVAALVCGFLAMKYGDEFWYAVLGRGRR